MTTNQPAPGGEPLQAAAEAFDNLLLKIVTEGQTVVDDEGNVQKVDPTAAMMNVIRQRLKDAGISGASPQSKTKGLGGVRQKLIDQGKLKLSGLPPVSDEDDRATA
jgi:hypothetical protein